MGATLLPKAIRIDDLAGELWRDVGAMMDLTGYGTLGFGDVDGGIRQTLAGQDAIASLAPRFGRTVSRTVRLDGEWLDYDPSELAVTHAACRALRAEDRDQDAGGPATARHGVDWNREGTALGLRRLQAILEAIMSSEGIEATAARTASPEPEPAMI